MSPLCVCVCRKGSEAKERIQSNNSIYIGPLDMSYIMFFSVYVMSPVRKFVKKPRVPYNTAVIHAIYLGNCL